MNFWLSLPKVNELLTEILLDLRDCSVKIPAFFDTLILLRREIMPQLEVREVEPQSVLCNKGFIIRIRPTPKCETN